MQPLAVLHPTVRLSHWRQVWKNIHSRVRIPGLTWSVLHPGGPPSWFPPWLGDMSLIHWRLSEIPLKVGYPRYHSILPSPRRASLLVPLPIDLGAFGHQHLIAHYFLVRYFFLFSLELHRMQKLPLIKEFIELNVEFIKKYSNLLIIVKGLNPQKRRVNYPSWGITADS